MTSRLGPLLGGETAIAATSSMLAILASARSISAALILIPPRFIVSSARPKILKCPLARRCIWSPCRRNTCPDSAAGILLK